MKKILLSLLALLSLQAYSRVDESVAFDFTNPSILSFSPEVTIASGEGDVVLITDCKIISGPVTISFSKDTGDQGVVINNNGQFNLKIRNRAIMNIEVSGGCTLSSVQFEGYLGDLGTVNTVTKRWEAYDTNTKSVSFPNATAATAITKISVRYSRPSTPLSLSSSSPAEGSTHIGEFSAMDLHFNSNITKVDGSGIKLSGGSISGSQSMNASFTNSTLTLKADPAIKTYGRYTVTIPSGAITNFEGSVNESDIVINFIVDPVRTTVSYSSVSPVEGTYNELPADYILSFSDDVALPETPLDGKMYKDGELKYKVTLSALDNKKQIKLTNSHGIITPTEDKTDNTGTWTIVVPEAAIHNSFPGDESDDRWNAEFTLTYKLESATSIQMAAAKELAAKTGIGYPTADSDGRKALDAAIAKGDKATVEELEDAMAMFKAETNVTLPEAGENKYYRIYAESKDGKKLYLTYRNEAVTLTTQEGEAYSFLASKNEDNTYVFATADEKYLHVLTSVNDYDGTSNKNVTPSTGSIRNLTLAKLAVEGEDIIGLLTIHGSLGLDKDKAEASAFATVNFDNNSIATSAGNVAQFTSGLSSGFRFVLGTKPADVSEAVVPKVTLDKSELEKAGDPMVLTVHYVDKATIKDATKPYFSQNGEKVKFTGTILTAKDGSNYEFNVNTKGLAAGNYILNLPVGTFNYEKKDKSVTDYQMTIDFSIKGTGSSEDDKTVTPAVKLSASSINKAGDALTLTVQNVDRATLKNSTLPYYSQNGAKITFNETILTTNGSNTEFSVNTKGLAAGSYYLYIPTGTFNYEVANKTVTDVLMSVQFTVKAEGSTTPDKPDQPDTPTTGFKYTYESQVVLQTLTRGDGAIQDKDLNELVLFAYYNGKDGGIACDPKQRVLVGESYTKGDMGYGHFEAYPNFAKDYAGVVSEASQCEAIRLVMDKPIEAGLLEQNPGMYGYYIPAGTFGDHKFGEYIKNPKGSVKPEDCTVNKESYAIFFYVHNERARIQYPSAATMNKAVWLQNTTGVGYPVATSPARTSLSNKIRNGQGNDAEFEAEFKKMYDETNVVKPTSGKYYSIQAQALDGTKAYLNYNGKTIGVSKNAAEATGFLATSNSDGTFQLQTGDGKYMAQLNAAENVSAKYDAAKNGITLTKLQVKDVNNEKTYGLLSIMAEKMYAVVNIKEAKMDAVTSELNTFTNDKTPGFMFVEVSKENIPAPKVTPILTPASSTVNELKDITITFNGIDKVVLSDRSLITLTDDKKNVQTPSVSSASDKDNEFVLTFSDVKPDQTYTLSIGEGAFTFIFAERTVKIGATSATYTVKEPLATEKQIAEAKELLSKTGMGYPLPTSPARMALQVIADNGGTLAAYNTAVDNYYKDENVMKPGSGRWYRISAFSPDNKEAYLQYDGTIISLTMDAKAATAFKTEINPDGTYSFVTGDGKYLQMPVAGSTNLTAKLDDKVNSLAIVKLPIEKTLGLLGIYGTLADGKSDYAVVDMAKPAFATAAGTGAKYATGLTGAFHFVEVQSADIPAPKVAILLSPADKAEMDVLEKVTVTFNGIDKVKKDEVKLISLKGESDGKTYTPADVVAVSDNVYDITFAGLPLGQDYTLTIGTGAFAFDFAERSVIIDGAKATYTVHEAHATAEQIAAAKKLLENKGLGYPVSTSKARAALQKIVDSGTAAYVTPYTEAVNGFYGDTDVEKPENGKYYRVAAIAADGKEAYLAYDGETLTITTDVAKATGLKVVTHATGTFSLKTGDGKYVNVLKEASAAEVSQQSINRLNVKGIAAENTFGLFSLQGKGGFALVDMATAKIEAPSATSDTFDATKTNAFRFTLIDNNVIPVPTVTYSLTPADKAEVDVLETVTIAFEGKVDVEVSQNASKTIVLVDGEGNSYSLKAITKTKTNVYALTFENIAVGHDYGLAITKGTFLYHFADREFPINAISAKYSVKEPPASEAQIKEALELLQLTGTGYPSATSKARGLLQSLVDKGGNRAEFNKAMEAYRNDMEVEMPANGKYYTVAAVSNDGKQLYLKADGKGIGLTDNKSAATAFKATVNKNGTLTFSTVDGQYLNPLTPKSIADGLSDTYTAGTNDFTLRRLQLDSYTLAETLGYFSIRDSEGTYAKVDMAEGYIMSSARSGLEFFDAYETNAFRLTETEEPTTGIRRIRIDGADAPVFDLQGRRVSELMQGQVYIKAGKKFVAK